MCACLLDRQASRLQEFDLPSLLPPLQLVVDLNGRQPEKEVITSQKTTIQDDTMETGREGAFHAEMVDAVRAVAYTVRAFDMHEKELRVANPGPYVVE